MLQTRTSPVVPFFVIALAAASLRAQAIDDGSLEHGARIGGYAVRFAQQDGAN